MKKQELIIVDADDWQALYVDGEIWGQDHEITVEDIASAANINLKREFADVDDNLGEFPKLLKDVSF